MEDTVSDVSPRCYGDHMIEGFDQEIAASHERLLDTMIQAKFATYGPERVPPLLEAMKADGSTLQVYGPPGYQLGDEIRVVETLLNVARPWMPDHTVIGLDTDRVLDYALAPDDDHKTKETLFEMTVLRPGTTSVILAHGYNGRDGATGDYIEYAIEGDEVDIKPSRFRLEMAWLSWSMMASNMERFLFPGLTDGYRPFDEAAEEAHAEGCAIFAINHSEEGIIFVQAWGEEHVDVALRPGLSREKIEEDIAQILHV